MIAHPSRYGAKKVVQRGEAWYQQIRPKIEADNKGRYIAIDIETGDYEVDDDYHSLAKGILARKPDTALCILRIGYVAVGRIGGHMKTTQADLLMF